MALVTWADGFFYFAAAYNCCIVFFCLLHSLLELLAILPIHVIAMVSTSVFLRQVLPVSITEVALDSIEYSDGENPWIVVSPCPGMYLANISFPTSNATTRQKLQYWLSTQSRTCVEKYWRRLDLQLHSWLFQYFSNSTTCRDGCLPLSCTR